MYNKYMERDQIDKLLKISANRLKELRIAKNLTIEELSKIIKIPRSTISRYENNQTQPNTENIIKYCLIFDETPEYILGLEDIDRHREEDTFEFSYKDKYTEYKHKRR